jgi:phosphomannomutase
MEWNGLKLINGAGIFLDADETKSMNEEDEGWASTNEHRTLILDGLGVERHIEKISALDVLDLDALRRRRFKVVVDACNGAAYRAAPELLRRLGCEVTALNCELTGTFPRPTEPNPSALTDLKRAVTEIGADCGFATDPDADRLGVISKSAQPLGEEYTLALSAELLLSKQRGKAVTNISTSSLIDWVAKRHGGEVIRTPIGEAHVVRGMLASQAVIGGEGNGGVILPKVHPTRDSLTAMALTLQLLMEREESLEAIIEAFPTLKIVKKKVAIEGELREAKLRSHFDDGELDETDGLLFRYPDSWLSVRKSGTEPIVRVIAEAPTEERATALVDRAIGFLSPK